MKRAMVSGTRRRSWARALRSMSMSRLSLREASPSSAVWQMARKSAFVHVLQETVFEIGVAEPAGVVVPQDALHVGRGQDLAHHVEDGVVIEGVADLLQLVEQALEHPPFDGVGCDEVEDEAVAPLSVAMDAAPCAARAGSGSTGCHN